MRASTMPEVPMPIAAEASVWVSRLHGPHRSAQMERECLEWQSRSEAHRQAFERCTATWEEVRGVSLATAYAISAPSPAVHWTRANRLPRWAVALATLVIVTLGVVFSTPGGVSTGIGEQRVLVLNDGSRVTLNTDTRVFVNFSAAHRTISLDRGEALFEVAKDVGRPFVVRAAGGEVVAIGTVFSVRHTGDALAVTLIEGQVTVRPAPAEAGQSPAQQVMIQPGERLSLNAGRRNTAATVDKPRLEQVTAWRRGEASFDDVPLDEAVAEMNRYSRIRIVLADDGLAARRVSGVFRTGDNLAFAQAVAALHDLTVGDRHGRFELTQRPRSPDRALLQPQRPSPR